MHTFSGELLIHTSVSLCACEKENNAQVGLLRHGAGVCNVTRSLKVRDTFKRLEVGCTVWWHHVS